MIICSQTVKFDLLIHAFWFATEDVVHHNEGQQARAENSHFCPFKGLFP